MSGDIQQHDGIHDRAAEIVKPGPGSETIDERNPDIDRVGPLPMQRSRYRILQLRILELIPRRHELGRLHTLAAEKEFFAHLSKNQLDGEGGHDRTRGLTDS